MRILIIISLSLTACFFNSCSGSSQPSVSASTSVAIPQGKLEALERRIAARIELNRKAAGLKPMNYHPQIADLARKHSDKLKKKFMKSGKRVLNHDGFNSRGDKILLDHSMSRAAENVAYIWGENGDPVTRFNRNWMKSPGHRDNILKTWNYTGVGVAVCPDGTIFATQLFGLKTDFTF